MLSQKQGVMLQWGAVVWQGSKGVSVTSILFTMVELLGPPAFWWGCFHNFSPQGGTSRPWILVGLLCRKKWTGWRESFPSYLRTLALKILLWISGSPTDPGTETEGGRLPCTSVWQSHPLKARKPTELFQSLWDSFLASPPWPWEMAFLPEDEHVQRIDFSGRKCLALTTYELGTSGEMWRIYSIVLWEDLCKKTWNNPMWPHLTK